MNILLLVVDSLRARSLDPRQVGRPKTPFLDSLRERTVTFTAARASECWTLPTHMSMFTGLLPSEHGSHFQNMSYGKAAPTIAEVLTQAGYVSELVTRNSMFDGSLPGVTRGFTHLDLPLAPMRTSLHPLTLLLVLSKPRVRRLIRDSGFFNTVQRENGEFLRRLARMIIPADALALERVLDRFRHARRETSPSFVFCNLYDVHAPYPPLPSSPLSSFRSAQGWIDNLSLPWVSAHLGAHAYLRDGFRFARRTQAMLLRRYHRAIELMDQKLATFWQALADEHVLDNTVVILTSDHGEAFGDHDLYFHDASVYDTHLRVPLWIHHPDMEPRQVAETVSARQLFRLMVSLGQGNGIAGTMLDRSVPSANPVALAEHVHYPHVADAKPIYREDIAAAIVGDRKAIVRAGVVDLYDVGADPDELSPVRGSIDDFATACRRDGAPARAVDEALAHLRRWCARSPQPRCSASRSSVVSVAA